MSHRTRRIVAFGLFAFIAFGAGSLVAKQVSASRHACCGDESSASDATSPCHGFLPLSCCQTAALPASDAGTVAPSHALAVRAAPPVLPIPPTSVPTREAALLAPRASPARLSVVQQV